MTLYGAATSQKAERQLSLAIWLSAIAAAALVSLFISYQFARVQAIWIDETTQMSGLTLSISDLFRWLAGENQGRFGVPGDRMPPMSYILGMAWASVFGLSEFSMRLFGLLVSSIGFIPFAASLRMISDRRTSLLIFLFFALSPNFITTSVEIRSYSLFLTLASTGTWLLIVYSTASQRQSQRITAYAMALVGILAAYTHFFGVIFGGCLLGAAFVVDVSRRQFNGHLITAGFVFLVLIGGLLPFITGANSLSSPDDIYAAKISDYVRMLYRLIAGPAFAIYPVFLFLYLTGILLMLFGVTDKTVHAIRSLIRREKVDGIYRVVLGLGMFIAFGVFGTFFSSIFIKNFSALKPTYSIWMTPIILLLIATSLNPAHSSKVITRFVEAGLAIAAIGFAGAVIVFVNNLSIFTHGPATLLNRWVADAQLESVVIYSSEDPWAFGYFPLYYEFGSGQRQFLVSGFGDKRSFQEITKSGLIPATDPLIENGRPIIVSLDTWDSSDIASFIRGQRKFTDRNKLAEDLMTSGKWRVEKDEAWPSFISARVLMLDQVP